MKTFCAVFLALVLFSGCAKKIAAPSPAPSTPPSTEEPAKEPSTSPPPLEHHHEHHNDVKIPTPLAQLEQAPLDVAAACLNSQCEVFLLYCNRLEILNWSDGQKQSISLPEAFLSSVRSRAPNGKIIPFASGVIALSNCLAHAAYFSMDAKNPPAVFTQKLEWLPAPQSGFNWFSLQDGRFYDFEKYSSTAMAAIDTSFHLNIAQQGNLATSSEKVGGKLCVSPSAIYTSSPSLPAEANDAVLKFDLTSLQRTASRPVDGQILDLAISDLNQDGEQELLLTLQTANGILIDVMEPF